MVTSWNVAASWNIFQKYVDMKIREPYKPDLYFYELATKATKWTWSDRIVVNVFQRMTRTAANALVTTPWVTPADSDFQIVPIEIQPKQYILITTLTDELLAINANKTGLIDTALNGLRENFSRIIDNVIQTELSTNVSQRYYAGWVASRSLIAAWSGWRLQSVDLVSSAAYLKAKATPTFEGGDFVAVTHPNTYTDMFLEGWTGKLTVIEAAKYATPEKLFNWEVGKIAGVRIVVSPNVQVLATNGWVGGNQTIYPTYVIWKEAFAVSEWQNGMNAYITDWSASDSDPAAQRRKVSLKQMFGVKIIRQEAITILETNSAYTFSL